MAMTKCPECGKEISDAAYDCPGCGCPLRRRVQPDQPYPARPPDGQGGCLSCVLKSVLVGILGILALISVGTMLRGCFGNGPTVPGAPVSSGQPQGGMSAEKAAAMMLNLNGHLCAEAVRITPLKQPKVYEVRCIEYRGGAGTVDYVLDMNTGVGWRR